MPFRVHDESPRDWRSPQERGESVGCELLHLDVAESRKDVSVEVLLIALESARSTFAGGNHRFEPSDVLGGHLSECDLRWAFPGVDSLGRRTMFLPRAWGRHSAIATSRSGV